MNIARYFSCLINIIWKKDKLLPSFPLFPSSLPPPFLLSLPPSGSLLLLQFFFTFPLSFLPPFLLPSFSPSLFSLFSLPSSASLFLLQSSFTFPLSLSFPFSSLLPSFCPFFGLPPSPLLLPRFISLPFTFPLKVCPLKNTLMRYLINEHGRRIMEGQCIIYWLTFQRSLYTTHTQRNYCLLRTHRGLDDFAFAFLKTCK